LLALAASRAALDDAKLDGFDPNRVGILFGSAIGGVNGLLDQQDTLRDRGPDRVSPNFLPNILVDSASGQLAISLGIKGPNYAIVSACATGSHAVGEAAELIKRGDADAVIAGSSEACMHPLILAGFTAMRGRGGAPAARLAPLRRDSGRLRHGRRRRCAAARGLGAGGAAWCRDLRGRARLRRLQRRPPHGRRRWASRR
jgi:3-oxoacyl-[acyl-carrier-protein] synthase II